MEAAFFDLDKTIIARPSLAAYGPVLRKAGYLSATTTLRAIWGQLLFRFSGTSESSMERVRKTALKLAAGWEQEGLRRLANEHLTNVIEPIVFDEALEVLNLHREAGRLLVLVSASPAEIVEPLANHLEVDEYVANENVTGIINALGAGVPSRFTPINANSEDNSLVIGVKQIYQGAWNPVAGLGDIYSNQNWWR